MENKENNTQNSSWNIQTEFDVSWLNSTAPPCNGWGHPLPFLHFYHHQPPTLGRPITKRYSQDPTPEDFSVSTTPTFLSPSELQNDPRWNPRTARRIAETLREEQPSNQDLQRKILYPNGQLGEDTLDEYLRPIVLVNKNPMANHYYRPGTTNKLNKFPPGDSGVPSQHSGHGLTNGIFYPQSYQPSVIQTVPNDIPCNFTLPYGIPARDKVVESSVNTINSLMVCACNRKDQNLVNPGRFSWAP